MYRHVPRPPNLPSNAICVPGSYPVERWGGPRHCRRPVHHWSVPGGLVTRWPWLRPAIGCRMIVRPHCTLIVTVGYGNRNVTIIKAIVPQELSIDTVTPVRSIGDIYIVPPLLASNVRCMRDIPVEYCYATSSRTAF